MGLEIIGAGFGRTGTLSLKTAIEQLGFGPCYHMFEVLSHLEHAAIWAAAADGEPVDYTEVFAAYRSTVDWPACRFWRPLMDTFPDAKVLLSVRPPERWFASFHETIYQVVTREFPPELAADPVFAAVRRMSDEVVNVGSFGADVATLSKDEIIAAYERHNAEVRAGVPAGRLLEFDVAHGWEPLCAFLGVPVPETAFPNVNDRPMFRQLFGLDEDPSADRATSQAEFESRFRAELE